MAMANFETLTFKADGPVARITLNRPERGNGITPRMPVEIAECVERANLDPAVHVIALAGNGSGFCGGYDLVASAEGDMSELGGVEAPAGSPLDPATIGANHTPETNWDPVTDYQFMSRNVRGFMSLFHSEKPVLCKVHGYCVAGGTDMALCSDLLVVADDAKIGYPPARVWGSPTTALWAARVARLPINQLVMMKLLVNQGLYAQGLHQTQLLGTFFDGIARHTEEGHAFVRRAAEAGFKEAVRERDEPFGDYGLGGHGVE